MLTVGVGSYGIACLAGLGLIVLLSIRWISRHWTIMALVAVTSIWAALGLAAGLGVEGIAKAYGAADILRPLALLLVMNHALQRLSSTGRQDRKGWMSTLPIPLAIALAAGIGTLNGIADIDVAFWAPIGQIGLAVMGLVLIESLLKASRPGALWSTKHLLIGAGAVFAFDLFVYTDALLLLRVDETLRAAQPVIATLALPLMLISASRLKDVRIDLPVSRGLVVGTTALFASGIYILSVAVIAYLIRGLGWAWGPTLQLIFLFGAGMVLLVLLSSTSLRHGGRRFIERNLFTFAYDYRREWLRLVESMAGKGDAGDLSELTLDRRALKATADLMDADGGALFMRNTTGALHYKTSWNVALEDGAPGTPPEALLDALSPTHPALVLDDPADLPADIADWLHAFKDPWIALALVARNEVVGLALVTRPRMRRRLSWEDLDILSIFAHQLGSYLTVEELARHVAETEHFERMSKHITFVAHDLKNVIGQLSLVLQQATRHAHDPAFVSDTFLTIGDATERMKRLMQRVQEGAGQTPMQPVDLTELLTEAKARRPIDRLDLPPETLTVDADPAAMATLLDHLIDNAHEANVASESADRPAVSLILRRERQFAVIEVVDQGVGMTPEFIETRLFKPFASTKRAGFGIGMYQCRDWIERWNGRLEVMSEPGKGTTMRVSLPLAGDEASESGDAAFADGREPLKECAA